MEEGKIVASVTIDGGSPWFSGHFPGDPIFPGIAQLKMVADLVAKSGAENVSLTGLSRVKFRKIVRPGDVLDIQAICGRNDKQYNFKITSGNQDICSGLMFFTQNEKAKK